MLRPKYFICLGIIYFLDKQFTRNAEEIEKKIRTNEDETRPRSRGRGSEGLAMMYHEMYLTTRRFTRPETKIVTKGGQDKSRTFLVPHFSGDDCGIFLRV